MRKTVVVKRMAGPESVGVKWSKEMAVGGSE